MITRMYKSKFKAQSGVALIEFMIWSQFIAGSFVYGVFKVYEHGLVRIKTVSAARFVAWERTAWLPNKNIMSASDLSGVVGATTKNDSEILRDVSRHIFRDRTNKPGDIHSYANLEFESNVVPTTPNVLLSVNTTIANYKDKNLQNMKSFADDVQKTITGLGSKETPSLKNFAFWNGGYLKNEVKSSYTVASYLLPNGVNISEQVTMLTEPWNAGGTLREEAKIQGLVLMKMIDNDFNRSLRGTLGPLTEAIKKLYAVYNEDLTSFGIVPGGAKEVVPLDRHEQEAGWFGFGQPKPGFFRPYRALPATPTLSSIE